jgi:rhodanese-related sulfurtransferase
MKLQSLKPHDFNQHLLQATQILIDVRQPEEWQQAHIQGAKLIPLATLPKHLGMDLKDHEQPIYVYCQHGVRSHQAGLLLLSLGYTKVYQLEGGLAQWMAAGFPCQSGLIQR